MYWIPVYQLLESRGLEVCLVNVILTNCSVVQRWIDACHRSHLSPGAQDLVVSGVD